MAANDAFIICPICHLFSQYMNGSAAMIAAATELQLSNIKPRAVAIWPRSCCRNYQIPTSIGMRMMEGGGGRWLRSLFNVQSYGNAGVFYYNGSRGHLVLRSKNYLLPTFTPGEPGTSGRPLWEACHQFVFIFAFIAKLVFFRA